MQRSPLIQNFRREMSFLKKLASNNAMMEKAMDMGNKFIDEKFKGNSSRKDAVNEPATEEWKYKKSDTATRRALFVGINYTGTKSELRGCHADVQNLKSFVEKHGFSSQNMRVLMDVVGAPSDTQPTRANMLAGMKWLAEGAKAGDSLFLHYSGHGSHQKDTDGDEGDGEDETICPVDYDTAGMIVDDDIHALVCKPLPAGVKLTAIFDCCHSGSAMDLPFTYTVDGNLQIVETDNRAVAAKHALRAGLSYLRGDTAGAMRGLKEGFTALTVKSNGSGGAVAEASVKDRTCVADVVLFSGCMDTQTSADAQIDGNATGAMSHAFIASMQQHNDNVTYKDLLKTIREKLQNGYEQVPQMSAGRKVDMSVKFDL